MKRFGCHVVCWGQWWVWFHFSLRLFFCHFLVFFVFFLHSCSFCSVDLLIFIFLRLALTFLVFFFFIYFYFFIFLFNTLPHISSFVIYYYYFFFYWPLSWCIRSGHNAWLFFFVTFIVGGLVWLAFYFRDVFCVYPLFYFILFFYHYHPWFAFFYCSLTLLPLFIFFCFLSHIVIVYLNLFVSLSLLSSLTYKLWKCCLLIYLIILNSFIIIAILVTKI